MTTDIVIDVWGDFACFTQSDTKVERVTYPVPTPSACRGILNAIYCKPLEFYYEIRKIEVMNPIKYLSMKKNEVYRKADPKHEPLFVEEIRTQRGTMYLKDVYYRIHADIHKRPDYLEVPTNAKFVTQFNKRVKNGKCFFQPYLGLSECIAHFSLPDLEKKSSVEDIELGVMLYDIFDITTNIPIDTAKKTGKTRVAYYAPRMVNGVIDVPEYSSNLVLKV